MSTKLFLADSNIIIYALNSSSPKHKAAQVFLQAHASHLALAHQNVLESLRVLTHHKFSSPMTPAEATRAIMSIAEACRVITPDRTTYYLALELIRKYKLPGDKIFDAYLAATALTNGVSTIATDNTKDFAAIEELETINPFK
ncbi:MAG TPA: PIN domain-containing protein [Candidatus Saccharimonadales bacterium]|jgi:predicted nucleic acid-binding protein